jgi:hypothetical protein
MLQSHKKSMHFQALLCFAMGIKARKTVIIRHMQTPTRHAQQQQQILMHLFQSNKKRLKEQ